MGKKIIMLVLFTGIVLSTMAQKLNDYNDNWKKIADFEKKGLTKSALVEVLNIYKKAQNEKNEAQQIKSCMYQIKYRNIIEEDSHENNIFFVDSLIKNATSPSKNILQSMQAEMYWHYLQTNRWKFYGRTKLEEEKNNDIATWSVQKLISVITNLYTASLQNENILKTTTPDKFGAIILQGENTAALRPTLYDILAHRALSYFTTDENQITKPAYYYKIDDAKAFAATVDFINNRFTTKDTTSLQFKAILLFQNILKFHIPDQNPEAIIDADLIRLNFINQYATMDNKENLYEAALKIIVDKYSNNQASAMASFLMATIYKNRGDKFDPNFNIKTQYDIKKSIEICETTISKFPNSQGAISCQNLIAQIIKPSFNFQTEKVNTINDAFKSLVTYTNVAKLYFRVIKTNRAEIKKIENNEYKKTWDLYTALKPLKTWSVLLPNLNDFQTHSTEIKIDGLESGVYYLLASISENFSLSKNIICKQIVYVSDISLLNNNNNNYYVVNRKTGQPFFNAQIQTWENKYSNQTSNYNEIKTEKYVSNKNGMFIPKLGKEYRNVLFDITTTNDELFLDDNNEFNIYNSIENTNLNPQTFLFTDRSIYRPGQLLYFKGIVIQKNISNQKSEILSKYKTTIILKNANYQKVAELNVITNEYGSFNGSFKLPEGELNGQFSLNDTSNNYNVYFNIEEYKRPKFFVEIQKPSGIYRVNDSIKITGFAKAYAGNNIDGAKIKYRVVRKIQYPYWYQWGYLSKGRLSMPYGKNEEVEISNGEESTDEKGNFKITFKALPDETINKINQPTFYYDINADITDLNGETRSGNTSIAVAYQSLQLNIETPEKIDLESIKNLKIISTNINNIFEKALVSLSITKIQPPNKIFRERYWQVPDQFILNKEAFYSFFPYDVYKDEDQINKWELEKTSIINNDTTQINGNWKIPVDELTAGWYKIIANTKDKYGEDVKAEKFIEIFTNDLATSKNPKAISFDINKNIAAPNDKIEYKIKTYFDNIWLVQTISKMNNNNETSYLNIKALDNYKNNIEINESDRGGIILNYVFVQNNRIYKLIQNIDIPWSNKNLNITYQTFRDKLLPGAKEKFTLKIEGTKGEKIAAEMLATMYDASLDQFKNHNWEKLNLWPTIYNNLIWNAFSFEKIESDEFNNIATKFIDIKAKVYPQLGIKNISSNEEMFPWVDENNKFLYEITARPRTLMMRGAVSMSAPSAEGASAQDPRPTISFSKSKQDGILVEKTLDTTASKKNKYQTGNESNIQIRKNFNETAFFFPDLKTDENGSISFEFTMPEALTKWKLMTLAHTKEVASGYQEKTIITQKKLMVQPNVPRFLREGDRMELSTKIVNLDNKEITGTAQLELIDAATNKSIDGWFKNMFPTQYFTTAAGQSSVVKFPIEIPFNFNSAVLYRIKATTNIDNELITDGEETAIPILTNRMLVTESLPINLHNTNTKSFKFDKLINSTNSNTLINHSLVVEYTNNPVWYAIQALPYLTENTFDCVEQIFNKFYANSLATQISNSNPKIKSVFEKWKNIDTEAVQSNLQKNEELKSALLQETPWVLDAKNESQQKKNIALLFDLAKMSEQTEQTLNKLKEMQSNNGGFVWFKGGPDDRYITQYILTGIGHLKKLNAITESSFIKLKPIINKAIFYLDNKLKLDYDNLIKYKVKLKENNLSNMAIQYLYMRSFFNEYAIAENTKMAFNYYKSQAQKYWLTNNKYMQAMIALALNNNYDDVTAKAIIKSLKENAIYNEELGMYWKEWATAGYYWHQAPIESQSIMIEAFSEIDKNNNTIDELKTWLLKQKQTKNWKTTKATADACYALLLKGNNWLNDDKEVVIQLGNMIIKSNENITEAGTGYFKKQIDGEKINPIMGNINITKNNSSQNVNSTSWGSVYWQYFEDLDKITSAETPLKIKKKLYIEKNSDNGPILIPLVDSTTLKVGDKIKVRIELKVDRDMEYVHMKDMRASCMEPINVISQYKYQDGLGYYETTKDASTNFFFGYLNKGNYVFEYPMYITHQGNFSNGITSIQCMYAPEFSSHSEGVRLRVE